MSWLSRAMCCCVKDISLSFWGYPWVCCFCVFACIAWVNLYSLSVCFFYVPYQMCIKCVTLSRNRRIADVTCCRWTAFAFHFKLIPHCRHFIHRFGRVTLHARLPQIVLWWKNKKLGLGSTFKIADSQSVKKCQYRPWSRSCRSDRNIPNWKQMRPRLQWIQHILSPGLKLCSVKSPQKGCSLHQSAYLHERVASYDWQDCH